MESQGGCKIPVCVICKIIWQLSSSTCEPSWQWCEEADLMYRSRVHEEEKRIHAFVSCASGAMEYGISVIHGYRNDLICKLCKE